MSASRRDGAITLTADGALLARRTVLGAPRIDGCCAITALGLRALRRGGGGAPIAEARMIAFLERCRAESPVGAYRFWPLASRPEWASAVPPDTDDTALALMELHCRGHLSRAECVRRVATAILPCRRRTIDAADPPWLRPDAFLTWIAPRDTPASGGANLVDCAVNANIVALLARLGLRGVAGYAAAVETIVGALRWAGSEPMRLRALTPFYGTPYELADALVHAGEQGCRTLARAGQRLRARVPAAATPDPTACVCTGAYATRGWSSPALAALRRTGPTTLH